MRVYSPKLQTISMHPGHWEAGALSRRSGAPGRWAFLLSFVSRQTVLVSKCHYFNYVPVTVLGALLHDERKISIEPLRFS
jgi:hypothetical protein